MPKDNLGASPVEMMELREKLREELRQGKMDQRSIEVEVKDKPTQGFQIFGNQGMEEMNINLQGMMPGLFPTKSRKRRMTVGEARDHLLREATDRQVHVAEQVSVGPERLLALVFEAPQLNPRRFARLQG